MFCLIKYAFAAVMSCFHNRVVSQRKADVRLQLLIKAPARIARLGAAHVLPLAILLRVTMYVVAGPHLDSELNLLQQWS